MPVSELTLVIEGANYRLARQGDSWQLSKAGSRAAYFCTPRRWGGGGFCSCTDFQRRRAGLPGGACKHVRALMEWDLLPAFEAPARLKS